MTAAKVMDVIARLPDCDGQAADAASVCGPVKMEDAPRMLIIQNVQTYGYVFDDTNDQNLGQTLKIQWFLSNGICMDSHSLVSCGTDSSRKFCRK